MTDQIIQEPSSKTLAISSFIAPAVSVEEAIERYNQLHQFISLSLVADHDYGTVTGINKPTLLKPGAEKLATFFSLRPVFVIEKEVEDWIGKLTEGEPFFFYKYRCQLYRNGELVAEGLGSCNSREKKYRYRWVTEENIPPELKNNSLQVTDGSISEFLFAINASETTGKYGKPATYWENFKNQIQAGTAKKVMRMTKRGEQIAYEIGGKLFAIPNTEIPDLVNTFDKMAQKRAFVAAVLIGANASDYFTQDVEGIATPPTTTPEDGEANIIDLKATEVKAEPSKKTEAKPTGGLKPRVATTEEEEKKVNCLNEDVVNMFIQTTGLAQQEAIALIVALKKDGKLQNYMTMNAFEEIAQANVRVEKTQEPEQPTLQ
ncbi:MAG: hypothetical protein WC341_00460 [Bacteroidales bacterium]|jgi:hypothetical protein